MSQEKTELPATVSNRLQKYGSGSLMTSCPLLNVFILTKFSMTYTWNSDVLDPYVKLFIYNYI